MRIGGLVRDLPEDFPVRTKDFLKIVKEKLIHYDELLTGNVIFVNRTKGIGVISKELAINYALSGPMLRGSGVKWDIRKGEPYCGYETYDFDIPVGVTGDVYDRYTVRMEEIKQSIKIVEQALERLEPGEFRGKIPKKVAPPKGEIYFRVETPRGELGVYLVSDGSSKPYRFKVRAPSFCNLSISEAIMKDCYMADLPAIIGSIDFILGDVDR
jgi:NADH-quinone oxidoreductase subunit D